MDDTSSVTKWSGIYLNQRSSEVGNLGEWTLRSSAVYVNYFAISGILMLQSDAFN
jgi:hypothetical protein